MKKSEISAWPATQTETCLISCLPEWPNKQRSLFLSAFCGTDALLPYVGKYFRRHLKVRCQSHGPFCKFLARVTGPTLRLFDIMSEISQINFRLLADLRGDFDNAGRLRHINGRVT